jgi:hypothetical protein
MDIPDDVREAVKRGLDTAATIKLMEAVHGSLEAIKQILSHLTNEDTSNSVEIKLQYLGEEITSIEERLHYLKGGK